MEDLAKVVQQHLEIIENEGYCVFFVGALNFSPIDISKVQIEAKNSRNSCEMLNLIQTIKETIVNEGLDSVYAKYDNLDPILIDALLKIEEGNLDAEIM